MPYRIDLDGQPAGAHDALIDLGALDIDIVDGALAAILPDHVATTQVAAAIGNARFTVGAARGRDGGSVWLLHPRAVQAGAFRITPATGPEQEGALRLEDGSAFGTGLHPTTALCLDVLDLELRTSRPARILDVGAGSGVLALAALSRGVEHAVAVDIDAIAVAATAANGQLNGLAPRLHVVRAGPDALAGTWPLVVANILAAPLVEMAPTLARLVGRGGCLVLSGIRSSLAPDVRSAYRRVGMHQRDERSRDGWTALVFLASW